jgi:hypothetical protein
VRYIRRTLRAIWRYVRYGHHSVHEGYCLRCDGCGEDMCCSAERCDFGPLCGKLYGDKSQRLAIIRDRGPGWDD